MDKHTMACNVSYSEMAPSPLLLIQPWGLLHQPEAEPRAVTEGNKLLTLQPLLSGHLTTRRGEQVLVFSTGVMGSVMVG